MWPVYYTEDPVDVEDLDTAMRSWYMILNDHSPVWLDYKFNGKSIDFISNDLLSSCETCVMLFYHVFYSRLFDIHPMCKPMFRNSIISQGVALVKMVSLGLNVLNNSIKFDETLSKLTDIHNKKGIKAIEYGIMVDCFLWSFNKVLGPTVYTSLCAQAWTRIFSRMIRVMIPLAVTYELQNDIQKDRKIQISSENKPFFLNTTTTIKLNDTIDNSCSYVTSKQSNTSNNSNMRCPYCNQLTVSNNMNDEMKPEDTSENA